MGFEKKKKKSVVTSVGDWNGNGEDNDTNCHFDAGHLASCVGYVSHNSYNDHKGVALA